MSKNNILVNEDSTFFDIHKSNEIIEFPLTNIDKTTQQKQQKQEEHQDLIFQIKSCKLSKTYKKDKTFDICKISLYGRLI